MKHGAPAVAHWLHCQKASHRAAQPTDYAGQAVPGIRDGLMDSPGLPLAVCRDSRLVVPAFVAGCLQGEQSLQPPAAGAETDSVLVVDEDHVVATT
jgi:hypothetical protein